MNTSYGERKVRVETVDGNFIIKKKEEILPTDRIISYISNDYIQPIKIKIVDLNIILAFLLGAVARIAFYAGINKGKLFILSYGKFKSSIKLFTETYKALFKYNMEYIASLTSYTVLYNSFSLYKINIKPSKLSTDILMKVTTRILEKYIPIEKVRIGIQTITDVIVSKITYKKIKDITQGTIEQDILGDKTIFDLIEEIADT